MGLSIGFCIKCCSCVLYTSKFPIVFGLPSISDVPRITVDVAYLDFGAEVSNLVFIDHTHKAR